MGIVSRRVRLQVYKKCNERCAYCGNPVVFAQMQVDHLVPCYWTCSDEELLRMGATRGTDHFDNLMPSCRRCNKWKTVYNIEVFRGEVKKQPERLLRDVPGYKLALDFGLIQLAPWDGLFYFEKMPGFSVQHIRTKS